MRTGDGGGIPCRRGRGRGTMVRAHWQVGPRTDVSEDTVSAQPVHQAHGPVPAIPQTIDEVASALPAAQRMAFYREVGQVTADDAPAVIKEWWLRATLHRVQGREERVEAALAGRDLVSLAELADGLGVELATG